MSNLSVCQRYIEWARAALEEWDGVCTAELFLAVLDRTGEDRGEVLQRVEKIAIMREES